MILFSVSTVHCDYLTLSYRNMNVAFITQRADNLELFLSRDIVIVLQLSTKPCDLNTSHQNSHSGSDFCMKAGIQIWFSWSTPLLHAYADSWGSTSPIDDQDTRGTAMIQSELSEMGISWRRNHSGSHGSIQKYPRQANEKPYVASCDKETRYCWRASAPPYGCS